ncbi:alanine racemase [Opitutus sp. GAS368]|uniref:alanine racemase n=1 Tax=Opitutus sp. GAS368 TaxID=1882749 RepID=UPI00087A083C|nr:alanine racemase [Opitutus sp. GAS368]SDR71744.1 alanine racemase [Opitutus sp. GAS368]
MNSSSVTIGSRPAWVEIDVARWRRNLAIIRSQLPAPVGWISVIKDDAYGHGALLAARLATEGKAAMLAVCNLGEALQLRQAGVRERILLLGERRPEEFPGCLANDLTCCLGDLELLPDLAAQARKTGRQVPVHLKVNTGMNRYGVPWTAAAEAVTRIEGLTGRPLRVEGVFSHFAMSDEMDKTFAQLQLKRFHESLRRWPDRAGPAPLRHLCNSGGFLDLPEAHLDLVRLGILPLGVYPSAVCRRLPGIEPVMSVKAKITAVRQIQAGDQVGYGLRYTAPTRRDIAVLPVGYGDGFPRVRNAGHVLLQGRRVPIIGGVSMDALMVDVTDVPGTKTGDTVVLMGRDHGEEISAHELARLKQSVSYEILCGWRERLPRIHVNELP